MLYAFLSKSAQHDSYADVGVKAVTTLRERAGFKIGNFEQNNVGSASYTDGQNSAKYGFVQSEIT